MEVDIEELVYVLRMATKRLLNELGKSPYAIRGKHYVLWYRGDALPCLVAHVDHVYSEDEGWDRRPIFYDGECIWSPFGVAGDDRCGVYACMRLFYELEVNVLFTDLEERGGVGAIEACSCNELLQTPYFVEIDRRNMREAVFYNGEEVLIPEFVDVVSRYFTITQGIFSDVTILGRHFKVAAVNVSAGFYNEHQCSAEYIHVPSLRYTMEKVPQLVSELGGRRYMLPELSLYCYSC